MYHERTRKEIAMGRARAVVVVCLVVLMLVACIAGVLSFQESTKEQSATSIKDSIISSAMQCYAIEGSYPPSLRHLKDVYGLTVNENDYIIHYEWFADNIPPSVAVSAR